MMHESDTLMIITGIVFSVLAIFIVAWFLMLSFNGSVAQISRARAMTYWQAFAFLFFILLTGMILFGWTKSMKY